MSSKKFNITQKQANDLYKMIKDVHDLFTDNNIQYWVTGGTLLGAIRHQGIIPHDDDGDVCIMRKDVSKLRKIVSKIEKMGYDIEEGDILDPKLKCKEKYDSCTWFMSPKKKDSLGLDIFVMEEVGPIITYSDPYWRNASNGGKACFFLTRFVFPLVPVRFGNFFVMTPRNSIMHLNKCYGSDWNSMSQRLFDHREGKWIISKKIPIDAEGYMTIPPPKSTCSSEIPNIPCTLFRKPKCKTIKDLTGFEVELISKMFKVRGRSKMNLTQLRKRLIEICVF
jgi:hypothetical protein